MCSAIILRESCNTTVFPGLSKKHLAFIDPDEIDFEQGYKVRSIIEYMKWFN